MTTRTTTCPSCGGAVRPLWPSCRSCGTLLMAAPAPVVPVGAPVASAGPSTEEQFFAPAVMQAAVQFPPRLEHEYGRPAGSGSSMYGGGGAGRWVLLGGMVVFFIAAVATMYFTFHPGAGAHTQEPVVLAPRAPTEGLPTSLDAIVRIQAESTRHTALQAVEVVGSADPGALSNSQPNYQWVAGTQPSTDAHVVSVAGSANGTVTIAVSASNHDICAFGQWTANGVAQYVTMAHLPSCAAVNAPQTNWSSEAGGAASDLPDPNG